MTHKTFEGWWVMRDTSLNGKKLAEAAWKGALKSEDVVQLEASHHIKMENDYRFTGDIKPGVVERMPDSTVLVSEQDLMLKLANDITASSHPEDPRLEVAYAIARYLKLDWPSAYDDTQPSNKSFASWWADLVEGLDPESVEVEDLARIAYEAAKGE